MRYWLRVSEMATTANHSNPVTGRRSSLAAPRVLVADDEPANVQLVGALLGKLGCEVVPAFDGRTALRRLALRLPDLILLDPLLPGLDGIETCRRIRRNGRWRHIPILFLSTADDPSLIALALEAGGADYIKQPCSLAELRRRLQTQLQRPIKKDVLLPVAQPNNEAAVPAPLAAEDSLSDSVMAVVPWKNHRRRQRRRFVNIVHFGADILATLRRFFGMAVDGLPHRRRQRVAVLTAATAVPATEVKL